MTPATGSMSPSNHLSCNGFIALPMPRAPKLSMGALLSLKLWQMPPTANRCHVSNVCSSGRAMVCVTRCLFRHSSYVWVETGGRGECCSPKEEAFLPSVRGPTQPENDVFLWSELRQRRAQDTGHLVRGRTPGLGWRWGSRGRLRAFPRLWPSRAAVCSSRFRFDGCAEGRRNLPRAVIVGGDTAQNPLVPLPQLLLPFPALKKEPRSKRIEGQPHGSESNRQNE